MALRAVPLAGLRRAALAPQPCDKEAATRLAAEEQQVLTGIEEEYDMKELLKARRPVVIRAKKRVQQLSNGPGDANTTAQINWKVKLTPVN
jgi:hypothetical protein